MLGAATLMTPGRDLIHADPQVRESTIKFIMGLVVLAKELDGRILTIVPSQVGKLTPMASPEEEWRWAVESLKEIYAYSEAAGITLALEADQSLRDQFHQPRRSSIVPGTGRRPELRHRARCLPYQHRGS